MSNRRARRPDTREGYFTGFQSPDLYLHPIVGVVSPEVCSTTPRPHSLVQRLLLPSRGWPAHPSLIKGRAGHWGWVPKLVKASEGRQLGSSPQGPRGGVQHLLPQQLSRGSAPSLRGGHSAVHTSPAAPEAGRAAPAPAPPRTRPDRANKPAPQAQETCNHL